MTEPKRFKVAIVGAGVGQGHAGGVVQRPNQFELAVVCDLNLERAKAIAGKVPGCRTEKSLDAVLADPEIDIVDLCLPPHLHYTAILAALEAGKHVIGEKPLVTSLAEMDAVEAAAERSGKRVFPVLQYRFGDGYRRLMHLIETGLAGRALTATLETYWRREASYYAEPWRGTWAGECGGTVVSHAIHIHDLMAHALGPVTRVAAFLDTRCNPIETEDCAAISFATSSGALVTSSITLGAASNTSRMRLCFENFTAESGLEPYTVGHEGWRFEAKTPALQTEIDAACATLPEAPFRYAGLYAEIHKALVGAPAPLLPDLKAARHAMEMISAIYHAHREGVVASLPLARDHPLYEGWSLEPAPAAARASS